MSDSVEITSWVKAQYEAFPYPHYNLFLPLRQQEAYASHSLFAARLLRQTGHRPVADQGHPAPVLLAGCGDTFPYLAASWEPRRHHLVAVDLSASNLRRARLRCWPQLRSITWLRGNLEDPNLVLPNNLAHIDSYGVLHHLANPARVLQRFENLLAPGGTARIMVYNREARRWLHHLQKALALLGLSAFDRDDLITAKALLVRLSAVSPPLRERFASMGSGGFTNFSRLVDTFFHAREAQLGLDFWLGAIAQSGLKIIGVFDRYAELDDLPNPLFQVPNAQAWNERILDRRFENNFELYLAKTGPLHDVNCPRLGVSRFPKTPPKSWFEYPETQNLPWYTRLRIWSCFLRGFGGKSLESADAWARQLPPKALARLGRLGAIFPEDLSSSELRQLLIHPLHDVMEVPDYPQPTALRQHREIGAEIQRILQKKKQPGKYFEQVMKRLEAAQRA